MYYVSACPSYEFRATLKSQIGPRGATLQPKQGEHTIFRHDNTVVCVNVRSVLWRPPFARAFDAARAETMQDS
jgi:hypothetical protein